MKTKFHELTDRWAAMLLVLVIIFFLFAGPLSQKADAVVVSSVIVGAVIATMALAGITFVASGMTAAQLQDWVSEKLNEWAADLGSPLDHLINSAGIGVTISGLLTVGTAAAQGISDFISWFKTDTGLTDNDSYEAITGGAFFGEIPVLITNSVTFNNTAYSNVIISTNIDCGYVLSREDSVNSYVTIVNNVPFTYSMSSPFNSSQAAQQVRAGYYVGTIGSNRYNQIISIVPNIPSFNNVLSYMMSHDLGTLTSSGSLSLESGVLTLPQVDEDEKVFLNVGAMPGSTVTEVTDGVISDAVSNTLDVSGEVAESEPEYVIDGPEPVYGLADVFPFCIPFDLYDFVSCLAADPVAPHFEWRLYVEDLVDYTFVIDLQQFETVAQIFRTMFLLAFIIGLAMVTRHLLRS